MRIHHTQSTVSAPTLDTVGVGEAKHTDTDSNDIRLNEQRIFFTPFSQGPSQFAAIGANPIRSFSQPIETMNDCLRRFKNQWQLANTIQNLAVFLCDCCLWHLQTGSMSCLYL